MLNPLTNSLRDSRFFWIFDKGDIISADIQKTGQNNLTIKNTKDGDHSNAGSKCALFSIRYKILTRVSNGSVFESTDNGKIYEGFPSKF